MTWISNHIIIELWDVIGHSCHSVTGDLTAPPLKLRHRLGITWHVKFCFLLLIHALTYNGLFKTFCRNQSRYAPSQWETSLYCNGVSHWMGAYLDWSLIMKSNPRNAMWSLTIWFATTVIFSNALDLLLIGIFLFERSTKMTQVIVKTHHRCFAPRSE